MQLSLYLVKCLYGNIISSTSVEQPFPQRVPRLTPVKRALVFLGTFLVWQCIYITVISGLCIRDGKHCTETLCKHTGKHIYFS